PNSGLRADRDVSHDAIPRDKTRCHRRDVCVLSFLSLKNWYAQETDDVSICRSHLSVQLPSEETHTSRFKTYIYSKPPLPGLQTKIGAPGKVVHNPTGHKHIGNK